MRSATARPLARASKIEAAPVTPDFALLHPGYRFAKRTSAKTKTGSHLSHFVSVSLLMKTVAWHNSGALSRAARTELL
jgi:hypothetical protein